MRHDNLLKSSLMILLIFFASTGLWGQLAQWDPGSLGQTWGPNPWNATTKDANVTVTGLVRGSGFGTSGTPASGSYGGSGANQNSAAAAISGGDFFTMTIKANTGYRMSVTGIPTWFTRKSGSGTMSVLVQYSTNGSTFTDIGTINVTSTSGTGTSTPLSFPTNIQQALANVPSTTTVTFRFVAISSTNANLYLVIGSGNRLILSGTATVASSPCPTPTPGTIEDQEVNVPQTATFTIEGAAGYTSVQWQRNTGSVWANISGATATTYTTEATDTSMDGYRYRAILTNSGSSCTTTTANTNEAFLFVSELVAAPEIEDANLAGTVGISFNYQIVNNGGTADSYEVVDGELPTGLNLNPATGQITGTPTVAGDFGAGIQAENGEGIGEAWLDFSIAKGTQTVTGLTDLSKNINEEPFTLPSTTNAGLTLSYESSDISVATVSGNIVTLVGLGSTTITATQEGNNDWNAFTQDIILTVVDGPCGGETFELIGAAASAYVTRTWTGDGGIEWSATQARTDRTDIDGSKAIGIRAVGSGSSSGEVGELTNTTVITGGIGSLSFDYARIFSSGAPSIQVFVNGVQYGGDILIPTGTPNPISEFNEIINIAEDATILIKVLSTSNDRIVIDNLSWTCFEAPADEIIWTLEDEWSNVDGPTASDDVIIEGNLVTSSDLSANNLTVSPGGSLSISEGNSLTLAGTITNNATAAAFVVENGANLIQTTDAVNTGEITVYQNSASMMRNQMALWSSPVSGQGIRAFSPQTLYNRFWTYNESNSIYTQLFTADTEEMDFAQGAGYAIRVRNNLPTGQSEVKQGEFIGVPFNGNVTVPVSFNQDGYNIVGNPYPSNIDAQEFFAANTNVEAVYFWNRQYPIGSPDYDNNYATFSIAGGNFDELDFISKAQGFIVKVPAAGSVIFNNTMRVSDDATFYKGTNEIEKHRIWISVSDGSQKLSQILLAYITGATEGFDKQIDAKLFGNGSALLYNLIGEDKFAIQGRSLPFETTDVVALGFKASVAGSYTIALENFDGLFSEGQVIYIKDLKNGIVHNLNEAAYTFEAEAGEFNNRFQIIYEEEDTMGTDDLLTGSIEIYRHNKNIVVASKSEKILSVELYDLNGRNIHSNDKINANLYEIASDSKGVLVVRVLTQKGEIVTKKVINN